MFAYFACNASGVVKRACWFLIRHSPIVATFALAVWLTVAHAPIEHPLVWVWCCVIWAVLSAIQSEVSRMQDEALEALEARRILDSIHSIKAKA